MKTLSLEEIIPKLTELGLVNDGKPLSFSAFKKYAEAHPYGRRPYIYIIFVGVKNNRFGFYPPKCNKLMSLKIAYQYYIDLFSDMKQEWLDGNVCWGNCGLPLAYGKLRIS